MDKLRICRIVLHDNLLPSDDAGIKKLFDKLCCLVIILTVDFSFSFSMNVIAVTQIY